MHNPSLAYKNQSRTNQYLVNEVMEATPQQLLIKLYDIAIVSCQKQDMIRTNKAIQELTNALNFNDDGAKEVSIGLLRLYQFCQDQMRKNNFDVVKKILTELRDSWISAFNK
ncbi:MAG: flagellar protein FliS [Ignavibacteriales bacterium]|nr:MAG: flagellar protein FliS [Ignavibacteriales bacterium]